MGNTFKTLTSNDKTTTRTLLHEAVPLTGSIISGTYEKPENGGDTSNIQTYSHEMFQTVYDYPFNSSSANKILDITAGYSADSPFSQSVNVTDQEKKIDMYNEMAQELVGFDSDGNLREFDKDGNIAGGGEKMRETFFLNFPRLLHKDEIKKDTVSLDVYTTGTLDWAGSNRDRLQELSASNPVNNYKVNSPAGEYALLKSGSSTVGHIYYQAGVAVVTASVFREGEFGQPDHSHDTNSVEHAMKSGTIDELADGFRHRTHDIDFQNTVELNSAVYFCRAQHNEFNYSSNQTYLSGSKIRVKQQRRDLPASYITTVGLYSADNELLAVAKTSEPIKKTPSGETNIKIRLDF